MKLITKAIEKALPALYSTDGKPLESRKGVVKFFTPWSSWTWYVLEGEKLGEDWEFFGLVDSGVYKPELGYFCLSELLKVKGPFGLRIERDRYYEGELPAIHWAEKTKEEVEFDA